MRGTRYDGLYSTVPRKEACQEEARSNPVALEEGTAGRDQEKKRSMSMYDFTVKDNVITVGDSYKTVESLPPLKETENG